MKGHASLSSTKTLVVWAFSLLAIYVFFAAASVYLFYKSGGQNIHLATEEGQQMLQVARRMSLLYFGAGLALLALWRVIYHHPLYNREYLRWLRTTP